MGQFNVRQFLLEPVNDGKDYEPNNSNYRCGCVKYAFDKVCGLTTDYSGYSDKRIQTMMDIAETILNAGYRERSKLFVAHCMERYLSDCTIDNGYNSGSNPIWSSYIRRHRIKSKSNIYPFSQNLRQPIVTKVKTRLKELVNV